MYWATPNELTNNSSTNGFSEHLHHMLIEGILSDLASDDADVEMSMLRESKFQNQLRLAVADNTRRQIGNAPVERKRTRFGTGSLRGRGR